MHVILCECNAALYVVFVQLGLAGHSTLVPPCPFTIAEREKGGGGVSQLLPSARKTWMLTWVCVRCDARTLCFYTVGVT